MSHVHSLNTSAAKQKYSFSKASRFQPYKANTDVSYLPPIRPDRRSAIIGYGQRSFSVDNKLQQMYPHAYDIPTTLKVNHGNSFKAGRHEIGGPLGHLKQVSSVPGPSQYQVPDTIDKKAASMKSRLLDLSLKHIKDIPGPGAYEVPSSLNTGDKNPFQSRFSNGGSLRLPPLNSKSVDIRTPTHASKPVPGPGQYDLQKYSLSNPEAIAFKKDGSAVFGKQLRQSMEKKNARSVPGPGQYKIYSEFDD